MLPESKTDAPFRGRQFLVRSIWAVAFLSWLIPVLVLLGGCDDPPSQSSVLHTSPYLGEFPRFPLQPGERNVPDVLVMYSPDDISSDITWAGLTNLGFFRLHEAYPELKHTMQLVPANRYLGDDNPRLRITQDPVAAEVWRTLHNDPRYTGWMEFGNHGYYHSPEGDPVLDHHEFNAEFNPDALDLEWCDRRFLLARETYSEIGLDNSRISVMRFPGFRNTTAALKALRRNDFLAYFEPGNPSGLEAWVSLGDSLEILQIPDLILEIYAHGPALLKAIDSGIVTNENLTRSPLYQDALDELKARIDHRVATGGIVNFFDHWWEHSFEKRNGVEYRWFLFCDALAYLKSRYGRRIWWGFGSELARWSYFKRYTDVGIHLIDDFHVDLRFRLRKPFSKYPQRAQLSYVLGWGNGPVRRLLGVRITDRQGTRELPDDTFWSDSTAAYFSFPFEDSCTVHLQLS